MSIRKAILCAVFGLLLAGWGVAPVYAQSSEEALTQAATAAFETWAQANELPYKDLVAEVQSLDEYFATVLVTVSTRPTQSDPWTQQNFPSECKRIGAVWKCSILSSSVDAQDNVELPREYASWFEALNSFAGIASLSAQVPNESGIDATITFAMVNRGDLKNSDYFLELYSTEDSYDNHQAILIKDDITADWEQYDAEWNVERRSEDSDTSGFLDALEQADVLLKSMFQQNALLSIASQTGVDVIGEREAVHYTLDVPAVMLQMLLSQISGGDVPSDIEFDKAQFEFWLDRDEHFVLRSRAEVIVRDTGSDESATVNLDMEIQNVDNVSLALPEEVRRQAMMLGLIEADWADDVIVVDENEATDQ